MMIIFSLLISIVSVVLSYCAFRAAVQARVYSELAEKSIERWLAVAADMSPEEARELGV